MAIVVNTNVSSLVSQRYLDNASTRVTDSLKKLSTGMKINSAADDAAGLYISKGIESQISGSKVCQDNIQTGINTMQIAEGDLSVIQDNLIRIKDLATQAASGTLSTASRNALKDEVSQRAAEINRIAGASSFNGIKLLDGSNQELNSKGLRIQVGAFSESATNAISIVGVFNNSEVSSLGLIKGSNGTSQATFTTIASAFANASTAAQFIADCEKAVTEVSTRRATLGANQNRLEAASESLAVTIENLSAAKSTIVDTDVASESAEFTQAQILQQTASSLLLQANQQPTLALSLLG